MENPIQLHGEHRETTISEDSLYKLYTEITNKQKYLLELREEIDHLKLEKKSQTIKQKLGEVTSLLTNINESQRKINSKKAATIQKLQRDNNVSTEKENILLSHKHQPDFKEVISNVQNVKTSLSKIDSNQHDVIEKHILQTSSLCNEYNKCLANDIHNFKSSKGLYNNMLLTNQYRDESMEEETESDLGCHPVDDSNSVNSSSDFFTSSPIFKMSMKTIKLSLKSGSDISDI